MHNNNPKISIVTPSFNSAKYIEDCIQSVLNQNYPYFEHIIIDGSSTDGTIEILKKYPHLNWMSEPDEGQSDALNKGFKMATGEIIGWLNSDDIYLSNTFEKVNKLLSDQMIDGVYSNLYFSDEKLNITRVLKSHRPIKWLSLFHCFIPSATFFFRRKIIDNGILIDKHKIIAMDKDFFANILYKNYKITYVEEYFSKFRWHLKNKSLGKNSKYLRISEGIDIFNKYSNLYVPNNRLTQIMYYFIDDYLLKIYSKLLRTICY